MAKKKAAKKKVVKKAAKKKVAKKKKQLTLLLVRRNTKIQFAHAAGFLFYHIFLYTNNESSQN